MIARAIITSSVLDIGVQRCLYHPLAKIREGERPMISYLLRAVDGTSSEAASILVDLVQPGGSRS